MSAKNQVMKVSKEKGSMLLFFKFLLKVGIIPLNLNSSTNELKFEMFSKPTLLFCIFSFLLFAIGGFFGLYVIGISVTLEFWGKMFNESETTDLITFIVYFLLYTIAVCNFKVYKDISKISTGLLLYKNLQWPKKGKILTFMTGLGFLALVTWLTFMVKTKVEYVSTTGLLLAACTNYGFNFFTSFTLVAFFLSWIDTLSMICEEWQPAGRIYQHSLKCRDYYKSLQNGLGNILLTFFTGQQILLVISLYKCITTAFYHPYDVPTNIVLTICYAIMSIFISTYIYVITMSAEELHTSFKSLAIPLNIALIAENEENNHNIKSLIKEIENMPPLNGNGYFEIKKGTITSIVSTTVTYLIILLQFRSS